MKTGRILFWFWLVLIPFLLYLNSLKHPLFWDDEVIITANAFLRSPRFIKEIFLTSYTQGAGELTNLYRPLAVFSFMAEYQLWGLSSFGYHLTNLLLHLVNGLLVFLMVNKIVGQFWTSYLTGFFFLIHPIQTEVVNYVSHRPELLMTFFLLLSFIAFIRYTETSKKRFLFASLVFYSLSALSKEMGLILPLLIFLYLKIVQRGRWKSLIPFGAVLGIYTILRLTTLNFLNLPILKYGAQAEPFSGDLWIRLLTAAKVHWIYLRLLFWPVNLHMDHDVPVAMSRLEPLGLTAMGGILWFLAAAFFVRKKYPIVAFGVFWHFGGLLPVSNFLPLNTAIAEHYLYLPSIGFFVAISALFIPPHPSLSPRRGERIKVRGGIGVFILLMILTFLRTLEWGNEEKLYLSTINNTRASFRANNNLGVYYFRKGENGKAEEYFKRSLAILPTYAEALNNLGAIYQRKGDLFGAIEYYEKSVERNPNYLLAHENLLALYRALKMKNETAKEEVAIRQIHQQLGFPLDKP